MDETQPPIKPDRSHRQDLVKLSWRIRLASCSVDGLWSLRAKDQRIAAYSICERTPGAGGNLSHILDLRAEHPGLQHNTLSALVASARSSFRSSCNSHVTIVTQDYLDLDLDRSPLGHQGYKLYSYIPIYYNYTSRTYLRLMDTNTLHREHLAICNLFCAMFISEATVSTCVGWHKCMLYYLKWQIKRDTQMQPWNVLQPDLSMMKALKVCA